MSFRLEITFSGLCMFVLDSEVKAAGERIHVLMPNAGDHKHFTRIAYSQDYEVPADKANKRMPNKVNKDLGIVQDDKRVVDMGKCATIDLATVLRGSIDAPARFPLPANLLNVSEIAKLARGEATPENRVAK